MDPIPLMFMVPPDLTELEALELFRAFVYTRSPLQVASLAGDKNEYIVACCDRRQTSEIMQYWMSLGLANLGHKLVLRGKHLLYGVSPLPQNRGIHSEHKLMLTAQPETIISIRGMLSDLNPSESLRHQIINLYNTKGVFIYENNPDQGFPCALALAPQTSARLNKPIEEYIRRPIREIDSDIAIQRQSEIERLMDECGAKSVYYRRRFLSYFTWGNRRWVLLNHASYSREDNAILLTIEDPPDHNGLRQQADFIDMIRDKLAEPNPEINWETIF